MNPELIELHKKVLDDNSLNFEQKKEMLDEIRKMIPPDQNRWNFRYAIMPLAVIALATPAYALIAAIRHTSPIDIPEALLSLSSTAIGALAAFLTGYGNKYNTPEKK